jgi:glutamate-1-semialdehyde 2,1-aminomutase
LSGNPVALAAGLATLELVQAPGFYDALAASAHTLCRRLTDAAASASLPFSAQSIGGMFGIYFRETPPQSYAEVMQCDAKLFNRFFHAMLGEGVYLAPSAYEAGFVSSAHGAREIDETVRAASHAFKQLRG